MFFFFPVDKESRTYLEDCQVNKPYFMHKLPKALNSKNKVQSTNYILILNHLNPRNYNNPKLDSDPGIWQKIYL